MLLLFPEQQPNLLVRQDKGGNISCTFIYFFLTVSYRPIPKKQRERPLLSFFPLIDRAKLYLVNMSIRRPRYFQEESNTSTKLRARIRKGLPRDREAPPFGPRTPSLPYSAKWGPEATEAAANVVCLLREEKARGSSRIQYRVRRNNGL